MQVPARTRYSITTSLISCQACHSPRSSVIISLWHSNGRSQPPRTKTKTLGPRGFYFASSAAWNALPVHLRDPELSLNSFKPKLKTHFFVLTCHLGYIYHLICSYKCAARAIGLNWIELNRVASELTVFDWIELNWIEMMLMTGSCPFPPIDCWIILLVNVLILYVINSV